MASLPGAAGAEVLSVPPDVCAQWAARGAQNAVRSVELTATCRLPARIARRGAERMAMASAEPGLVLAPTPPPSRYASMLILGVGF